MSSETPRTATEEWKWLRREVIIRDEYTCQDCGAVGGPKGDSSLHAHHKTPKSKGGSDKLENLITLCESCHHNRHRPENNQSPTCGRALTTDAEREYLRGEHGDQRMYEARSRVKARIRDRFAADVELFEEEAPELLEAVREVACDD